MEVAGAWMDESLSLQSAVESERTVQPAAWKQPFTSLAGRGQDIGAPRNTDLLPASSTWAMFNVVLADWSDPRGGPIC
jgi:hypothetical protein